MKVLITGGTGFLGYHLVQSCLQKNFDVTCLVRSSAFKTKKKIISNYKINGVNLEECDIAEKISLARDDYDIVFHLVGVYRSKDENELNRVNVEGTKNLLSFLLKNRIHPKRFVLMSSTAAMGPIKSANPLNEKTECKPSNSYEASKLKAEIITKDLSKGKINYTIIRTPRIYGPLDPQNTFSLFVKAGRIGFFPFLNDAVVPLAYVKNVADALILASTKRKASNQTFLIADEKNYSSKEIANTLAEILNKKGFFLKIPRAPLKFVSFFIGSYKYVLNDVRYSIEKAKKEIHYKPKYDLVSALKETIF